jgi:hypothetical protein
VFYFWTCGLDVSHCCRLSLFEPFFLDDAAQFRFDQPLQLLFTHTSICVRVYVCPSSAYTEDNAFSGPLPSELGLLISILLMYFGTSHLRNGLPCRESAGGTGAMWMPLCTLSLTLLLWFASFCNNNNTNNTQETIAY